MNAENPKIDAYLKDGCWRCPLGGTPDCKVHNWQAELRALRKIVLACGFVEELKWGVPCYTYQNNNVLLMSAFKEYCALSFFKGVLLKDEKGLLKKPGEHSQASRLLKFTDLQTIIEMEADIKDYLLEAIEIEKAGLKVQFKATADFDIPAELQQIFDEDPAFKNAFEDLTPGRQRGYLIHFSQAKQSTTRVSRIEKNMPRIFDGKGLHDL